MDIIEFKIPTKITFGANSLDSLTDIIKKYGGRAIIVTDGSSFNQVGLIDRIVGKLNENFINTMVYSEVSSNNTSDAADIIANLVRYSKADCIVAVGGFKVQNAAKGASVVVTNSGESSDYVNGQPVYHNPLPIISIPTILGSLSEMTFGMYLYDKYDEVYKECADSNIYVKDCIIDPTLYETVPVKYSLSSALSVFALSFDIYMSSSLNVINEPLIKYSMQTSISGINKMIIDAANIDNISSMSIANMLCAISACNANFGAIRALSIALNGVCSVNKSIVCSIMLPYVMEYYISSAPKKYHVLADFIEGIDKEMTSIEIGAQAGQYIKKIQQNINLPMRLNEINIDRNKFGKVAELALTYSGMDKLPRAMNKESIINLLDQAY